MKVVFQRFISYRSLISYLHKIYSDNTDEFGLRNNRACIAEALIVLMREGIISPFLAHKYFLKFEKKERDREEVLKDYDCI